MNKETLTAANGLNTQIEHVKTSIDSIKAIIDDSAPGGITEPAGDTLKKIVNDHTDLIDKEILDYIVKTVTEKQTKLLTELQEQFEKL